jgi:lipoyl(octanoyl) transferase
MASIGVVDLGRVDYAAGYAAQVAHHAEVLASREVEGEEVGRILTVEHVPPVITVSRRPGAEGNLLASRERLERLGVTVAETDRGGDITYHGPGQLVVYPIVDLQRLKLKLHEYMRVLEGAVIEALGEWGVKGERDPGATGVWVGGGGGEGGGSCLMPRASDAGKICAMGVRVRRWVTMHGLALNVTTDLRHFGLIVPCGLVGRRVTSLSEELGERCPSMEAVRGVVVGALERGLLRRDA